MIWIPGEIGRHSSENEKGENETRWNRWGGQLRRRYNQIKLGCCVAVALHSRPTFMRLHFCFLRFPSSCCSLYYALSLCISISEALQMLGTKVKRQGESRGKREGREWWKHWLLLLLLLLLIYFFHWTSAREKGDERAGQTFLFFSSLHLSCAFIFRHIELVTNPKYKKKS